jgi:hypothetical protein
VEGRRTSPWVWVRLGLVVFVLAWILGPGDIRQMVPIYVVFLVALGLEVNFLVGALRDEPAPAPDRGPQQVDRDRYGYDLDGDEPEPDAQPERRSSPVRRFLVGLGVIGLLVAAIWVVEDRTGWESVPGAARAEAVDRFSAEASRIAGKPVSIRCDEARDYVGAVQHADGVAIVGGEIAFLTPEICHALYELAAEEEVTGSRTGRALAVLAHESWHLRGVEAEATTECYALQSGVELGRRLGLDESTARQLMRQQLLENALRGVESLEYRVTAECRDGGRLDLDAGDSVFP